MTYLSMAKRLKLHRMMRIILLKNQYKKATAETVTLVNTQPNYTTFQRT